MPIPARKHHPLTSKTAWAVGRRLRRRCSNMCDIKSPPPSNINIKDRMGSRRRHLGRTFESQLATSSGDSQTLPSNINIKDCVGSRGGDSAGGAKETPPPTREVRYHVLYQIAATSSSHQNPKSPHRRATPKHFPPTSTST